MCRETCTHCLRVVYVRCQFVKDLVSGNVVSNNKKKRSPRENTPFQIRSYQVGITEEQLRNAQMELQNRTRVALRTSPSMHMKSYIISRA